MCRRCHLIDGHGGYRGRNRSYIRDLLDKDEIPIRITNMPGFGGTLTPKELDRLVVIVASQHRVRNR
jgi:mono/diheme cytochrome c family protein